MKLKVSTHSGLESSIVVESYDPIELNQQLNDMSVNTVVIGDVIFSRIDIKLVIPDLIEVPVEETTEEPV